ncbi:MAG: HEAT repeat domain-containing protein [Planctomycetota bacterium]
MSPHDGPRSRPGFLVVAILVAIALLAALWYVRRLPGALPVDELIGRLKSGTPIEQTAAAEGLGKLGDPAAVDPLIAALAAKEWSLRRAAALALGQLHDGRAVGPLTQRLEDDNVWVVIESAQALAKIGDASAVEPLEKRLKAEQKKKKDQQNTDLLTHIETAIKTLKSK